MSQYFVKSGFIYHFQKRQVEVSETNEAAQSQGKVANDEDENRFEIPTDQTILQNKNLNEIIYSDASGAISNVNNSDLFTTQSNDLESRLKYVFYHLCWVIVQN